MVKRIPIFCVLLFIVIIPYCKSFNNTNDEVIKSLVDSLNQCCLSVPIVTDIKDEDFDLQIHVKSQQDFDLLADKLQSSIRQGKKNISIVLDKNIYYFNERHIELSDYNNPDVIIDIRGNMSILIPKGRNYKAGSRSALNGASSLVNIQAMSSLVLWGKMMWADEIVEIIDTSTKMCRVGSKKVRGLNVPKGNDAYIEISRWCRCIQYKVDHIDDGMIYFIADDLEFITSFGTHEYNVNYDYIFAHKTPRFRLFLGTANENAHFCEVSNVISISNALFKRISLKDIQFLGGKRNLPLISLSNSRAETIEIGNCIFLGQKNVIVQCDGTNNLYFHDNEIRNNYGVAISSDNGSSNTTVYRNHFEDNGEDLSSDRCVICSGSSYYIAGNTFKNFGYSAICVGQVWHFSKKNPCWGIVENNEMYYDKQHYNNAWKYTIMDAGAIYVWTQNDGAIIRYNYIHDYTGMRQYRGIFCDDGAKNVYIYGNVIMNTANCHAIDLRRETSTERQNNAKSFSEKNNINNFIAYNITNGTIHFVGHEDEKNGCKKGKNFIILKKKEKQQKHSYKPEIKNLEITEDDIIMRYVRLSDRGVKVGRKTWKELQATPITGDIERWVRK